VVIDLRSTGTAEGGCPHMNIPASLLGNYRALSTVNEPFTRISREEDPTRTSNWPDSVTQSFFAVL